MRDDQYPGTTPPEEPSQPPVSEPPAERPIDEPLTPPDEPRVPPVSEPPVGPPIDDPSGPPTGTPEGDTPSADDSAVTRPYDAPPVYTGPDPVAESTTAPYAAQPYATPDRPAAAVPPVYGSGNQADYQTTHPNSAPAPAPKQRSGLGAAIGAAIATAIVVSLLVGLAAGYAGARLAETGVVVGGGSTQRVEVIPPKTDEPIVAASAAAVPSVVNIDVRAGTSGDGEGGLPEDHPSVPSVGNGSGVAYKKGPDGGTYIITNNHVVENAQRITVRANSGRSVDAKLIGRDPESDVAVLLVKSDIPAIELGDSEELQVGQTVVAIGSPYGLEHTVTTGVISALGRSLPDFTGSTEGAYPLVDVIQTDAAINPGNSGGALVDRQGRLVGINTAIYSDTGASGGIGFAIPSDTVQRVAEELIEGGEVRHPFLGIVGQSITPEVASEEKLPVEEGALDVEIARGSGAADADIKVGDIVTKLDGEPVRSMDDLILLVRRKKVGDEVTITLLRGKDEREVKVVIGDKPADLDTGSQETTPSSR